MDTQRSNASVIAVLIILLVLAGVIYLFWQNQQKIPPATEVVTPSVEESTSEPATITEPSAEVEAGAETN